MRHLVWGAIAGAMFAAAPVNAQTCESGDIYIFFGNGIETSRLDALSSLAELRAQVAPTVADSLRDKLEFRLSYNSDNLLFGDLLDSYGQWSAELEINFIRWARGLGNPPQWFTSIYDAFIRAIDAQQYIIDGDLRQHAERYRELTGQGHKVIVVSHSQGNFYANAAHRIVNSRSLGITAVATPAGVVEGGGPHTTLVGDIIANVPGALQPNVSNPTPGDAFNHGFLTSYMSGANSGPRIVSLVETMVRTLPYPEQEVESGIITVRLTWGAQPDVDLHVFEPGGAHVYYLNLVGAAGHLDVDDTDGAGPEHYYVSCETIQEGTYQVGVNYYRGNAPETAQIQISAGTVVRNYARTLPAQRGSGGNASPTPVATIAVTRNEDDELEFQINEATSSLSSEALDGGVLVPDPRPKTVRS